MIHLTPIEQEVRSMTARFTTNWPSSVRDSLTGRCSQVGNVLVWAGVSLEYGFKLRVGAVEGQLC